MKLAMIRVHRALKSLHPSARLLLQVHDELLLECPAEVADAVAERVRAEMESGLPAARAARGIDRTRRRPGSMSTERRVRPPGDSRFIVGLVGRTGSGKSTVARALAADGATVIDADALGHEVTDHDPEVRRGADRRVRSPTSTAPRARSIARVVAARVFTDPAARARLDRLVHPRIIERIRERLAALRRGSGVVVIDAALLLDWGLERWCDAVIAVDAPRVGSDGAACSGSGAGARKRRERRLVGATLGRGVSRGGRRHAGEPGHAARRWRAAARAAVSESARAARDPGEERMLTAADLRQAARSGRARPSTSLRRYL